MTQTSEFIRLQRIAQAAHFAQFHPEHPGYLGAPYRLAPGDYRLNLAPVIRDSAVRYFRDKEISWHRYASHGLSSQACCLNFLMPLAVRPEMLSCVVGRALGMSPPKMLPVETGPDGEPWFVGFEWIGERDYLQEEGRGARTRGANATSADAIVRFRTGLSVQTLLIEWKYTEVYKSAIPPKGNPTRVARYRDLAFHPHGPIRNDLELRLEDFFWEPFYQLLREQMLAFQMERVKEAGSDRVRVLHLSPSGNRALHQVTAPAMRAFGDDAFEAFSAVLTNRADFISLSIEDVFSDAVAAGQDDPWARYLAERYGFLAGPTQD